MNPGQGPLRAVLTAVDDGARTVADICLRTGLRNDIVQAALWHLERAGELSTTVLASGCPVGGCSACASRITTETGASAPGCGAPTADPDRPGAALVAFTRLRN